MSLFLSPVGNSQTFDANGDPLSGGRIYTYLAGSTTPAATYTDSTGVTQQANYITLNTLGMPPSPIWLTGGVAYKFVFTDAAGVTLPTLGGDNISGINDATNTASEWVDSGFVPTRLSATTFSVPGDQTDTLHIGRRLKTTNTAGAVYSTITASAFTTLTTVTVVNDSGTLDSGLSAVSYGLLSKANHSIPSFGLSIAANGYKIGADGLIEQWGSVTTAASGLATITFPLAFPTACYSGSLTVASGGIYYDADFDAALSGSKTSVAIRLNAALAQRVHYRFIGK